MLTLMACLCLVEPPGRDLPPSLDVGRLPSPAVVWRHYKEAIALWETCGRNTTADRQEWAAAWAEAERLMIGLHHLVEARKYRGLFCRAHLEIARRELGNSYYDPQTIPRRLEVLGAFTYWWH